MIKWIKLNLNSYKKRVLHVIHPQAFDHSVPCSVLPSESVPGCTCVNELDCYTLSTKSESEDGLAVPGLISILEGSLHREIPLAFLRCFLSHSNTSTQIDPKYERSGAEKSKK